MEKHSSGRKGPVVDGAVAGWLRMECMLKSVFLVVGAADDPGAAAGGPPGAPGRKKGWNAMALWHDRSECSKRISSALLRGHGGPRARWPLG